MTMTQPFCFELPKRSRDLVNMAAEQSAMSGGAPRDAAVMEAILKEMGVQQYEPNVVHQMLEFSYSEKLY